MKNNKGTALAFCFPCDLCYHRFELEITTFKSSYHYHQLTTYVISKPIRDKTNLKLRHNKKPKYIYSHIKVKSYFIE